MTENPNVPQGLWQKENESNNDYAKRLCKEITELSRLKFD